MGVAVERTAPEVAVGGATSAEAAPAPSPGSTADTAARNAPARSGAPAPGAAKATADASATERLFEDVRRLLKEGHADEARRRLREWREKYPDAALPEDLRDVLR
jgi:TolA-binding protein